MCCVRKNDDQETLAKQAVYKSSAITKQFAAQREYPWLADERELLRGLNYERVAKMMSQLLQSFETHATDRKANLHQECSE